MNYREVKGRNPDKGQFYIAHHELGQVMYLCWIPANEVWEDAEECQYGPQEITSWLEPIEPSKSAEEWFNRPENMQPGLADKFVHEAIPFDTWEDFIKYLAPYMEQYAQSKTQKP